VTTIDTEGAPRYCQSDRILWRDTASHVLVLQIGSRDTVTVLGGSSADLWRLLRRRHTKSEILASFADETGDAPVEQEVLDALDDLVRRGLVRVEETPE
jgi:ketosteroid isomerase-like protein